ncbi:MAG TPA: PSD1 and planctomycete cytochrome C domain-containing protein [Terriglobia bacterium]|nr:PSD1 and planctomycete cytochrome C domain-containing protein [Terriglobia bacterium]
MAAASVLWLGARPQAASPDQAALAEFFESKIRPVLASRCYSCHTGLKSGGLQLDSRPNILKGGNDGAVIVPGHPEDSLLIKAISHTHERIKMPLNGPKLDDETIENFKRWIHDGAVWPESREEFFDGRVRPVLAKNCLPCHGVTPQAGFVVDTREHLLQGGKSGAAIVPGDPDRSLLIQAVLQKQGRVKMPPGRRLSDQELADLVEWVKQGAAWSGGALTAASDGYRITPEQKAFWSFQPVKEPPVPKVKNSKWTQTPVDNFILARLQEKGLKPAPPAGKRVLIRRATYDLTGLPPTPEEVEAFVADRSPRAFAKVVDRLLASPHYGERWGRHWLDVVRYADTAGDSADYPVPQAYLYRNYVIYSFNQDKPYDEFIREQIAGDLLPAKSEADQWEHEIATGYVAVAKRFSVKPENYKYLTIDDTIDNLGKTFLGLSVACARCHDHKYDPIPSRDYYALYGILDGTRYPFAGSENINEQRDFVYRQPKEKVEAELKPFEDQLKPLDERLKQLEEERKKLDQAGTAATAAAGADSTPHPVAAHRTAEEINKEIRDVKKQRQAIRAGMPILETAYAVAEGTPHDASILLRGDPEKRGDVVSRHFLEILGGERMPSGAKDSGRLELADWIADPKNPLTARVMANRIWEYHFGKGIVATPSDFGKRGKAPTHPELLDYLAARFIASGWSIKAMHRLIMLSRVYQLSSDGPPPNLQADPGNDLYSRFNRQRLDAESIRDAMLKVSGDLDPTVGTAHPFPPPAEWNWTQHKPFAAVYETNQRSVYLMVQRSQRHPYLSLFDGADPTSARPSATAASPRCRRCSR